MTELDDETQIAYVDGELDRETRAAVERAMQTDAAIASRVARHRHLRERIALAHRDALDEPVPERLLRALVDTERREDAPPVTISNARARDSGRRWKLSSQWLAMAACLCVGVALGWLVPLMLRVS